MNFFSETTNTDKKWKLVPNARLPRQLHRTWSMWRDARPNQRGLSYRFPLCWSWPWGLYKSAALTVGWTSAFSEGRHTWPSWSGEHWCISCQLVQHPYPESIVASDLCVFESGSSQHFPLEVCHANIEEKSRMACRGCDEKPWPSETWPAVHRWFSCRRKQIVWGSQQC